MVHKQLYIILIFERMLYFVQNFEPVFVVFTLMELKIMYGIQHSVSFSRMEGQMLYFLQYFNIGGSASVKKLIFRAVTCFNE